MFLLVLLMNEKLISINNQMKGGNCLTESEMSRIKWDVGWEKSPFGNAWYGVCLCSIDHDFLNWHEKCALKLLKFMSLPKATLYLVAFTFYKGQILLTYVPLDSTRIGEHGVCQQGKLPLLHFYRLSHLFCFLPFYCK